MNTPKKHHGILFKAEMIRALLNGTKTQTRRIVKPQPQSNVFHSDGIWYDADCINPGVPIKCPLGAPGDGWYAKETFQAWTGGVTTEGEEYDEAEGPLNFGSNAYTFEYRATSNSRPEKWRPSIFMPRAASRISGTISEIRVERLNDISASDAVAEGIQPMAPGAAGHRLYNEVSRFTTDPVESYRSLWESINGPGSWDLNPWVFVYTLTQEKTK